MGDPGCKQPLSVRQLGAASQAMSYGWFGGDTFPWVQIISMIAWTAVLTPLAVKLVRPPLRPPSCSVVVAYRDSAQTARGLVLVIRHQELDRRGPRGAALQAARRARSTTTTPPWRPRSSTAMTVVSPPAPVMRVLTHVDPCRA